MNGGVSGDVEPPVGKSGRFSSSLGVFALALLLLPLGLGIRFGKSEIATNSGVAAPPLSLSVGYPGELATWIGEHATSKSVAIRADKWIDEQVYGEIPSAGSSSPRVLDGKSGVMFIADAFNEACRPHIETTDLVSQMEALEQVVRSSGRDFHLAISPDKSTVLQEFLPDSFDLQRCFTDYNDDFWNQLESSEISGWIDLRSPLVTARQQSRDLLFKKRDTHWDDAGALVATKAIVEELGEGIWEESDISYLGLGEYFGDLNVLSGETLVDEAPNYSIVRAGVSQENVVLVDDIEHGRNRRITNSSGLSELISGRTVVFGDSFSEVAEKFFVSFFEDVTLMRLVDFSVDGYVKLIDESDRVVFWSVERTFPYRVAFDWGTDEFIRAVENGVVKR